MDTINDHKVQIDQEELPKNHIQKQNKYIGMQNICQKIQKTAKLPQCNTKQCKKKHKVAQKRCNINSK